MYCDFFGLHCRPFGDRADTRFFYPTGDCEEALAAMEYESRYGQGMSLLLGEAGSGKTLLIRTLLQQLTHNDHVVVLTWQADGPDRSGGTMDLIRESCKGFGVTLPSAGNHGRCLSRLRRHLARTRKAGHRSMLIIDQAENLTAGNLGQLVTLTELQQDGDTLLSVFLVGQPHFRTLLHRPEFARIRQQLYGERVLPPLTLAETQEYVQHRLRIAGVGEKHPFDKEAVLMIHNASNGIPRLINRTCDAAMLAAYGTGEQRITRATVSGITAKRGTRERTIEARNLGLGSTSQVAAGLTSADQSEAVAQSTVQHAGAGGGDGVENDKAGHRPALQLWGTTLEEVKRGAERFQQEFVNTALVRCREQLQEQLDTHLHTQQQAVEAMLKRVSDVAVNADNAIDALRTTLDAAKTEAERFQRELTDAALSRSREKVRRQLEAHVHAQQEAVDATLLTHRNKLQTVIGKFTSQVQTLEERIAAGQEKVGRTIADCESAEGGPTEWVNTLVSKANHLHGAMQAAAAHIDEKIARLESHHDAAEHVLSNLSEANTVGHQLIELLQESKRKNEGAAEHAADRLTQLVAETDRAAVCLCEWIEEAQRVQSRLAGTLEQCPSLHETHPGDTLRSAFGGSRATGPAARFANHSTSGVLEMLNEPPSPEPPDQTRTTKSLAGTEEISQLIEDAKQASPDSSS